MESMRLGLSPTEAAEEALKRITSFYPNFNGALIAINITGHYGMYTLLIVSVFSLVKMSS